MVFIAFFANRNPKIYQNQLIQLANPHEIPMTNHLKHNWTNVFMVFAINRPIDSSLSHLPDALKTLNSRIIFCYHFSFFTYIHFCNLPLILPAGINLLQFFFTCFCIPLFFSGFITISKNLFKFLHCVSEAGIEILISTA